MNKLIWGAEWLQGDPDNLEGRIVIFSEVNSKVDIQFPDGSILTAPCFVEIFGAPSLEEISQRTNIPLNDLREDIGPDPIVEDPLEKTFHFFAHYSPPMFWQSKDFLKVYDKKEDIIYVGDFSDPNFCISSIKAMHSLYWSNFMEQTYKRLNDDPSLVEKMKSQPQKTYADFSGRKSIEGYIQNSYIDPMVEAKKRKDIQELSELEKRFVNFFPAGGSSMTEMMRVDAVSLSNIFQKMDIVPKELSFAYVSKINAIHTEDFELAAAKRNEIVKLREKYNLK